MNVVNIPLTRVVCVFITNHQKLSVQSTKVNVGCITMYSRGNAWNGNGLEEGEWPSRLAIKMHAGGKMVKQQ